MNIHFVPGPVHSPKDVAGVNSELRKLLHLDLLARGIYISRRGFMALSIPMTNADLESLAAAFDDIFEQRAALIAA